MVSSYCRGTCKYAARVVAPAAACWFSAVQDFPHHWRAGQSLAATESRLTCPVVSLGSILSKERDLFAPSGIRCVSTLKLWSMAAAYWHGVWAPFTLNECKSGSASLIQLLPEPQPLHGGKVSGEGRAGTFSKGGCRSGSTKNFKRLSIPSSNLSRQ